MKKLIIAVVFIFGTFGISAQNEKPIPNQKVREELSMVKDRLMLDFYTSLWMNVPQGVKVRGFNEGFNFSWLWDFKTGKKGGPVSFGLGLGVSYYTFYSNAILRKDTERDIMAFAILPEGFDYKRSRLNYTNINIPFEIRYRHKSGFKINAGIRLGIVADMRLAYKGNNLLDEGELKMNFIDKTVFSDYQKFSFEVTLKTGWKWFGVHAAYHVNKLFINDKGPKIYPVSVGITLSLF